MMSKIDREMERLDEYFTYLDKYILDHPEYVDKLSGNVQFHIGNNRWQIPKKSIAIHDSKQGSSNELSENNRLNTDKETIIKELNASKPPIRYTSVVKSDVDSFFGLIDGTLNPMRAMISGKVTIEGEKQIFRVLAPILRAVVKSMSSNLIESSKDFYHIGKIIDVISQSGRSAPLIIMSTHKESSSTQSQADHTLHTYYVIQLTQISTNDQHKEKISSQWQVMRRFSEFLLLRKNLLDQIVYLQLSPISRSTGVFSSSSELIKQRVKMLQSFIDDVFSQESLRSNRTTNELLGNFFGYRHVEPPSLVHDDDTTTIHLSRSQPIRCHSGCFPLVESFIHEINALKRERGSSSIMSSNQQVQLFVNSLRIVIVVILAAYLTDLCFPGADLHKAPRLLRRQAASILLAALVSLPTTLGCAVFGFLCHFILTSYHQHFVWEVFVRDLWMIGWQVGTRLDRLVGLVFNQPFQAAVFVCIVFLVRVLCRRFYRHFHILGLSSFIIAIYLNLKIISRVLRLSASAQKVLYDRVDGLLAPLVAMNIKSLKSIFIKFSQYFSLRSDIISSIWTSSLEQLQDSCEPSSPEYITQTLMKNFENLNDIFESMEMKPVASASIAQVHFAVLRQPFLRDHDLPSCYHDVVIKIQHESIEAIMKSDMNIMILVFNFVATYLDARWRLVVDVMRQWQASFDDELNFIAEANNMMEISQGLEKAPVDVIVPVPIRGLCSKRVLVMTRLRGFKVTDKLSLNACGVDRPALLRRIAHATAHQLLVLGFVIVNIHSFISHDITSQVIQFRSPSRELVCVSERVVTILPPGFA